MGFVCRYYHTVYTFLLSVRARTSGKIQGETWILYYCKDTMSRTPPICTPLDPRRGLNTKYHSIVFFFAARLTHPPPAYYRISRKQSHWSIATTAGRAFVLPVSKERRGNQGTASAYNTIIHSRKARQGKIENRKGGGRRRPR